MQEMDNIQRINFSLPKFRRIAWANESAKKYWEPVIKKVVMAKPKIFSHAVLSGFYRCAFIKVAAWQIIDLENFLTKQSQLVSIVLKTEGGKNDSNSLEHIYQYVVIGHPNDAKDFHVAWKKSNWDAILELLGAPDCCRFFHKNLRNKNIKDATLYQAFNSLLIERKSNTLILNNPITLNTLMRRLDIQILSYDPCSMNCQFSLNLANSWIYVGKQSGFSEDIDNLVKILSWPVEWSTLHGIAEIKTPILKISTDTDPLAEKYKIHKLSEDPYPKEAPLGIDFPYRRPKFAKVSDSKSFKQGLEKSVFNAQDFIQFQRKQKVESSETSSLNSFKKYLDQKTRTSKILDETLKIISSKVNLNNIKIKKIHLSNSFISIQLNNDSIGLSNNFFKFKSQKSAIKKESFLIADLSYDPLLLNYLFDKKKENLLELSLKTCLINALSEDLIFNSKDFNLRNSIDKNIFAHAESAAVFYYGGYMDYIITQTKIKKVHIVIPNCNIFYFKNLIDQYIKQYPEKNIQISIGENLTKELKKVDLICIRGMAFCDGHMDRWLEYSQQAKKIIIQDHNSFIYPKLLFSQNVSMVTSNQKPSYLMDLFKKDFKNFQKTLEGNLPLIHMISNSRPQLVPPPKSLRV